MTVRKLLAGLNHLMTFFLLGVFGASTSHAQDAATVVFNDGVIVDISEGFRELSNQLRGDKRGFVQLSVRAKPVVINTAEISLVCREDCSGVIMRGGKSGTTSANAASVQVQRRETNILLPRSPQPPVDPRQP